MGGINEDLLEEVMRTGWGCPKQRKQDVQATETWEPADGTGGQQFWIVGAQSKGLVKKPDKARSRGSEWHPRA